MNQRWLAALPVYNEVRYVDEILDQVRRYADDVLVVDDGSTDGTSEKLRDRDDVVVIRHDENRGYGAALTTAFDYTIAESFAGIVTLDCDGQHQPRRIPRFIDAAAAADMVSGSRYLRAYPGDDAPPAGRLLINKTITAEINQLCGFQLTDAFCGFKAYRTEALRAFKIDDPGYAMPLQLWVQAAAAGLGVIEIPVPLIYLDLERSFGGALDDSATRLEYYRRVIRDSVDAVHRRGGVMPGDSAASSGSCDKRGDRMVG